jgi:hypothetical protein
VYSPVDGESDPAGAVYLRRRPRAHKGRFLLVIVTAFARKKLLADSMTVSPGDTAMLAKDSVQLEAAEAHVPLAAHPRCQPRPALQHTKFQSSFFIGGFGGTHVGHAYSCLSA